jgi:hypothetical protein
MFPRRACQNCGRSIAIGSANQIRSHFCPHYKVCEFGTCRSCAEATRERRVAANDARFIDDAGGRRDQRFE